MQCNCTGHDRTLEINLFFFFAAIMAQKSDEKHISTFNDFDFLQCTACPHYCLATVSTEYLNDQWYFSLM